MVYAHDVIPPLSHVTHSNS